MSWEAPRARWLPRWHHWTIASLLLLFGVPVAVGAAYRAIGFRRYDAVIASQRARGVPTTVDDLLAFAPPMDESRQARWRAFVDSLASAGMPEDLALGDVAFADWGDGGNPPEKQIAAYEALASRIHEGLAVMREGTVIAGWFGRPHAGPVDAVAWCKATRSFPRELDAARIMMLWLEFDALQATDPTTALLDIDRVAEAFAHPAVIIDAMMDCVASEIRDETYLRLAYLHRLPSDRADAWRSEAPRHLAAVADGWRGERILSWLALVESDRRRTFAIGRDDDLAAMERPAGGLAGRAALYLFTGQDASIWTPSLLAVEERLRGLRADFPDSSVRSQLLGFGHTFSFNIVEASITGWDADTRHRVKRLASAIFQRGQPIPSDHTDFLAQYSTEPCLSAGGDRASLRYERLTERRFRLSIDPMTPVPNFADASRAAKESTIGKPPTHVGTPPRLVSLVTSRLQVEAEAPSDR